MDSPISGEEPSYDITELAAVSGLTVRTIRYYIQQKLVPPSESMGPGARYGQRHLTRLRLICFFQRKELSLAEIRKKFEAADLVGDLSQGSLDEYLEGLLAASPETEFTDPRTSTSDVQSPRAALCRSQWERITMTEAIEIHVRRPLNRVDSRNLERLVEAAKEIFGDSASRLSLVAPGRANS